MSVIGNFFTHNDNGRTIQASPAQANEALMQGRPAFEITETRVNDETFSAVKVSYLVDGKVCYPVYMTVQGNAAVALAVADDALVSWKRYAL